MNKEHANIRDMIYALRRGLWTSARHFDLDLELLCVERVKEGGLPGQLLHLLLVEPPLAQLAAAAPPLATSRGAGSGGW